MQPQIPQAWQFLDLITQYKIAHDALIGLLKSNGIFLVDKTDSTFEVFTQPFDHEKQRMSATFSQAVHYAVELLEVKRKTE